MMYSGHQWSLTQMSSSVPDHAKSLKFIKVYVWYWCIPYRIDPQSTKQDSLSLSSTSLRPMGVWECLFNLKMLLEKFLQIFGFEENYRTIRLNGGLEGHLAQPAFQNGVNNEFSPGWLKICPVQFLKPLRSTRSSCNFYCLVILTVKNVFLTSSQNVTCFVLWLLPFILRAPQ